MKNLLTFLVVLVTLSKSFFAQVCTNPQAKIDIHGNNIRARILNGGDLFTNFNNGVFFPNPGSTGNHNPSTIFAAGLWMGGIDQAGDLKIATVDYRSSGKYDYTAGPLNEDGTTTANDCANWDQHFRVTGAEIAGFLNALPLTPADLKAQFPGVAGWPGNANPYFSEIYGYDLPLNSQGLAPFFDTNQNGSYDPIEGDYPAVQLRGIPLFVPAEMVWSVFNDQNGGAPHSNSGGKPFRAEIQLTTWAFNCADQPVLNNTLFTSHKIINRGADPVDSTFIGIWADVDLGCSSDDYAGSNPALNTMYAYNQDAVDGMPGNECQGTPTFPDAAPVQSITFLNNPLSKFISPNNAGIGNPPLATTDPTNPSEIFNFLSGTWRDGSPLTFGGNGFGGNVPVDHLYSDDPANPNGWSMCTANLGFSDRRIIGTSKYGKLLPGQIEELNIAWAFHPNPSLPCGLGTTFSDVAKLRDLYNDDFAGVCSPLSKAPVLPADSLTLFPNPTATTALLRYGALQPFSLRAFDAAGRMVFEKTAGFEKKETIIETATLASGIYTLQIVTDQGVATKKLAVVR